MGQTAEGGYRQGPAAGGPRGREGSPVPRPLLASPGGRRAWQPAAFLCGLFSRGINQNNAEKGKGELGGCREGESPINRVIWCISRRLERLPGPEGQLRSRAGRAAAELGAKAGSGPARLIPAAKPRLRFRRPLRDWRGAGSRGRKSEEPSPGSSWPSAESVAASGSLT